MEQAEPVQGPVVHVEGEAAHPGKSRRLAEVLIDLLPRRFVRPERNVAIERNLDEILSDSLCATLIIAGFDSLERLVILTPSSTLAVSSPHVIRPVAHDVRQQEAIVSGCLPFIRCVL